MPYFFLRRLENASDASFFRRRGGRLEPIFFEWSQYFIFIAFSVRGDRLVSKIFECTANAKFDLLDMIHLAVTFPNLAWFFFLAEALLFRFLVPPLFVFFR